MTDLLSILKFQKPNLSLLYKMLIVQSLWLMPIIPVIWEAEIRRIAVQGQPDQIV
jgi:hypothetical protein